MRLVSYFLICVFLNSFTCLSQKPSDSLLRVYKDHSQPDTARLAALHYYIGNLLFTYPDSAEYLGLEEAKLAVKTGNHKWEGWGYGFVAISFALRGRDIDAIPYYEKAINVAESLGDLDGVGSNSINLGASFQKLGMLNNALDLYIKASKVHEQLKDTSSMASVTGNIGAVYMEQHEFDKAKNYLNKSLSYATLSNNQKVKSGVLINLGNLFIEEEQYEKAMALYKKANAIYVNLQNLFGIASSLDKIGNIHAAMGVLDSAAHFHNLAIEIHAKLNNEEGLAESFISLSKVYEKMNAPAKAVEYGRKGLAHAKATTYPFLIKDASHQLYLLLKKLNKIDEALSMFELSVVMKDSINNEEGRRETLRKAAEYEYEIRFAKDSIEQVQKALLREAELKAVNIEKDMQRKQESLAQKAETKRKSEQIFWLIGLLALATLIGIILYRSYLAKRNINLIISEQKEEVEEKNKEITDSINYAKRIQKAILPTDKQINTYLPNSFVTYLPKDIVAGDFYWLQTIKSKQNEDIILFAAADCTGHGVPGAIVSVVCNNALNRSVREHGLITPGDILNKTREIVIQEFDPHGDKTSDEEVKDGMDIALCSLVNNKLLYAGAHNPLWVIRSGSKIVEEIKADKQPVGRFDHHRPFSTNAIELNSGDCFYLFSDGFADQFGGPKGKKFKTANFKKLLISLNHLAMHEQKLEIERCFSDWKDSNGSPIEQLDDVCIIGVRI